MLRHQAGDAPDGSDIVDALVRIWLQVASRLTPVIGKRGVDVLFRRALQKAASAFPWLATATDNEGGAAVFRSHFASQDAESIFEAGCELLAIFAASLVTLIGESLAQRLLGATWSLSPSSVERVPTDEQ